MAEESTIVAVHGQRLETLEDSDEKQWTAINDIKNRPPIWATAVMSLLSFLSGGAMTYAALATRIAGH